MKTLIFLLFIVFFTTGLRAQTIDSAYFQCVYKLSYAKDSLDINRKQTDEMMLLIGNKYTSFCSYINYVADSLQKANPAEYSPQVASAGGNVRVLGAKTKLKRTDNVEVYIIEKASEVLLCMGKAGVKDFYDYTEELTLPKWEMLSEKQVILGYNCQKATANYGGRQWTVWFTPDILIGEGPWKLRGLPGMILRAEDTENHYVFECTNLGRLKSKRPIEKDTANRYRSISKQDFFKECRLTFENPIAAFSKAGVDLSSALMNGSIAKPNPKKYNPIELMN